MDLEKIYIEGAKLFKERRYEEAIAIYTPAAEDGDAKSEYELGSCLSCIEDLEKEANDPLYVKWYKKAATHGYAPAMYQLGLHYCYGINHDYKTAADWFRKAAEFGDTDAQYWLAYCYETGTGVEYDPKESFKWLCKAVEDGKASHMSKLAFAYYFGFGCKRDYAKSVEWYKKAAQMNDPRSTYWLGLHYYNGEGVEQDWKMAFNLFNKAKDYGYKASMIIGDCYLYGRGVDKDIDKGIEWYFKAIEEEKDYASIRNLADIYRYGLADVPCNYEEAIKLYTKAATEYYDEVAMYELGLCYTYGIGVLENISIAVSYFRQASRCNHKESFHELGTCYLLGTGVKKNPAIATRCYRKAAKLGYAPSMYSLAICYFDGNGVVANRKKAMYWLEQYMKEYELSDYQKQELQTRGVEY